MLAQLPLALADVSVSIGPTAIPRGNAIAEKDITIRNDLFAVAFAVETAPPWGVARGGIVDIAVVRDGEIGYDIASLADFMPNDWSGWPTTYQEVSIVKNTTDEAVVRTRRDWGQAALETEFHIRDGDPKIHITTRMSNPGKTVLEGLLSGYVVWPDGGYPIAESIISTAADGDPGAWTAAYDEDWALGLRAPFSTSVARDGRDRYMRHDLHPGQTRTFEAWLQVENSGTLARFVQSEIRFSELPFGRVSGLVMTADRASVELPVVVVNRGGRLFAWARGANGRYELDLPAGDYELSATASSHAAGAARSVHVSAGESITVDFDDVSPPGRIDIEVIDETTRRPVDARISIEDGYQPVVRYLGTNTFFTELDDIGTVSAPLAPGRYLMEVSAGGGFTATRQRIEANVLPGNSSELKVSVSRLANPAAHAWYGADLHHHSDVLDGFTEPEYVLRSQLAAGVDIAFLSDHDSVVNNRQMQALAAMRGRLFIPAAELSPSWAHFNIYPLHGVDSIDIDTGRSPVQEIFSAARKLGAELIEVNHPYSNYGYFESLDTNAVPGGYDAGFDLVEIKAGDTETNALTLQRVWQLWNEGHKKYLAAGSDVHDVWLHESGTARTYVHVDGDLSIAKYIAGLKAGRSYASQGPLIYPDIMFGSELTLPEGAALALTYSVQAVAGLNSIRLVERGKEIAMQRFDGNRQRVPVRFDVRTDADTWYSLVVEDLQGNYAYTNPVWVSISQ